MSWPEKTKKAVREKFATAFKAAADAGAVFTLIPERLSGVSTTIEVEDELILLMRDLLFKSGSCNPQQAFLTIWEKLFFSPKSLNPQMSFISSEDIYPLFLSLTNTCTDRKSMVVSSPVICLCSLSTHNQSKLRGGHLYGSQSLSAMATAEPP